MNEIIYGEGLTASDLNDVVVLLNQLTTKEPNLSEQRLEDVQKNAVVMTARNQEGKLLGMATLIFIRKLISLAGSCEDVVVDESCRGMGVGKKIMINLIEKAKELGLKQIDLTSAPHRETANNLYKKLGFEIRETNVYRLKLN